MIIYHGSNTIIEVPKVQVTGFNKDFGFGFYCTLLKKQAIRWAASKTPEHIVSEYQYEINPTLSILTFETMTEEWLDFITDCRKGIAHSYDIVEGPMADDTIWNYIEDYLAGDISREAFWILAKFKYPTHQIVFCTDRALQCLTFSKNYSI